MDGTNGGERTLQRAPRFVFFSGTDTMAQGVAVALCAQRPMETGVFAQATSAYPLGADLIGVQSCLSGRRLRS